MENDLLSVVVPIYNTEKYLDRCINSIVNQTYRNLEILLIDDGSPDHCPEICDAWARKDNRIRVVHKKNEGQGMARNTGIEHASGMYICFFDSDDYISQDAVAKAVDCLRKNDAELVVFGFHTVGQNGDVLSTFVPDASTQIYRGAQVQEQFLPEFVAPDPNGDGNRRFYMSSCMILYAMKPIRENNWRFKSEREIISEDVYSLLLLLKNIQSVAVLPEALYHYCVNEVSFSRKYMPGRYQRVKHFYLESVELCKQLGYNKEIIFRLSEPFLAFTVATLKQEAAANISISDRFVNLKTIASDELLHQVLGERRKDNTNIKKKILYWALRHKCYRLCYILLVLQNAVKG